MPISLLFEHFTLFLSWSPSYQSFLVFFLPTIISPWVSSWSLIQAHTLIVMSHLPSFVHCSSDFMCPLWSNLATYVDSQIYVNFGLTNMYPAWTPNMLSITFGMPERLKIQLSPASFPFCIPYLSVWFHDLYGYSGKKLSHLPLQLCKVTHYSFF